MKLFTQSAALLLACLAVLIIVSTQLINYMAPILGFLIIVSVIFIIIKQRASARSGQELFSGSNKEVFMITLTLLLGVFMTGGLNSPLYFLLYFLLFGIVFLFEPATVFVLLLGLGTVFFQSIFEGDLISNLIKLGSLAFLAPISYFFGREFQKKERLQDEIEDKTGQILEDANTLLKKSSERSEDEIDEINDIIEKSSDLRREAEKE